MSVWLVALKEEVIGSISKLTSVANGFPWCRKSLSDAERWH